MTRFVVCGYGIIGSRVVSHISKVTPDFCVIDSDPSVFEETRFAAIAGDAKVESVLAEAGVKDAEALICCTGSDVTNSFIILQAKSMNPDLLILTIAKKIESIEKLHMAGADHVISSSIIGGRSISKHAISPHVAEFVERITLSQSAEIADLVISTTSRLAGRKLRNSRIRETTGMTIIAVKKGEDLVPNPAAETVLEAGDILVAIGAREQIMKLAAMAKGREAGRQEERESRARSRPAA